MKIKVLPILILLTICNISLQSCYTVNIASNKLNTYTKKPKRFYIIEVCDNTTNVFCNGLFNGLINKLQQNGVKVDGIIQNSLSLESDIDINKKISSFNSEVVLKIVQTGTGSGKGVFEITLIDLETKKNVWKGDFDISANTYSSLEDSGMINDGVTAIFNKLVEDKII